MTTSPRNHLDDAIHYRQLAASHTARAAQMVSGVLVRLSSGHWVKMVPYPYRQAHRRAAGYTRAANAAMARAVQKELR